MKDREKGFQERSGAFAVEHKIRVPFLVGRGQGLKEEFYSVDCKIIFEGMNHKLS